MTRTAKKPTAKPTTVKTNPLVPNQGEEVYDAHARETVRALLAPVPDSPLLPHITVVVVTFRRLNEICRTIDALQQYLIYPSNKLHWLIADDHSDDTGEYVDTIINRYKHLDMKASVTPTNGGWGVNTNLALSRVETPYIFFLEDDTILTQPLDLRVGIALLEVKPEIGMVRYRGTAGDHVVLHQLEANIENYLPHYHDGTGVEGKLTYCLIDSGSPTAYVYSNGSHLKRKSFHAPENYGPYPEGKKLGHTEESFAITTKERMRLPNALAIAILPDYIKNVWDYCGTSWQHTEFDKGL